MRQAFSGTLHKLGLTTKEGKLLLSVFNACDHDGSGQVRGAPCPSCLCAGVARGFSVRGPLILCTMLQCTDRLDGILGPA